MQAHARCAFVLAFLSGFVLASPHAQAGDYYVDAANGDDANSGASASDAWRTITHGVATVPSGSQVLHIAPGLYDAILGETFPIFVRGGLTLRGDMGSGVTVLDGGGSAIVLRVGEGTTRFETLSLRNADSGIFCDLAWDQSSTTRLESVSISDMTGNGVSGTVTTLGQDAWLSVELTDVMIRDCGGAAVEIWSSCIFCDGSFAEASIVCSGSLIENNGAGLIAHIGLDIEAGSSAVVGSSRIVHNSGEAVRGGSVSVSDSVIAFNGGGCGGVFYGSASRSTIVWNAGAGMSDGVFSSPTVQNCILYGNGTDLSASDCSGVAYSNIGAGGACVGVAGNISADPLLVDPAGGDFRLAFGSPCIDSGDPAGVGIDGDLDLHERQDMGAIEHAPLFVAGVPTIGNLVTFELWGPAWGGARVYVARGATVPPALTPFGELDLDPTTLRPFMGGATAPGPPGEISFTIPPDPALVGATFSFQALSSSPVPTVRAAYTNPVTLTIQE